MCFITFISMKSSGIMLLMLPLYPCCGCRSVKVFYVCIISTCCVFFLLQRQPMLFFEILQFLFSCCILTLSWKISASTSKRTRKYSLLRSQKCTTASGTKTSEQFAPLLCHLHNRWHADGCYGRSAGIPGIYLQCAAHKCVPGTVVW